MHTNGAGRLRVLIVDAESVVRNFLAAALHKAGYGVLAAKNGVCARELFRRHAAELALMIVEIALPDMRGARFIGSLPTRQPRIPVVFTASVGDRDECQELPGPLLRKPFGAAELHRALREHALPLPRG